MIFYLVKMSVCLFVVLFKFSLAADPRPGLLPIIIVCSLHCFVTANIIVVIESPSLLGMMKFGLRSATPITGDTIRPFSLTVLSVISSSGVTLLTNIAHTLAPLTNVDLHRLCLRENQPRNARFLIVFTFGI